MAKKVFLHQKRSSALLRYNDAIIVRAWTNNLNLEMGPGDTDSQQVAKDWEKLYKAKEKELNGKWTLFTEQWFELIKIYYNLNRGESGPRSN